MPSVLNLFKRKTSYGILSFGIRRSSLLSDPFVSVLAFYFHHKQMQSLPFSSPLESLPTKSLYGFHCTDASRSECGSLTKIIMARFPVTTFHFPNDSIPNSQCLRYTPLECGLLLNTVCHRVFSQFNRIGVLHMFEIYPIRRSITSVTEYSPSFCRIFRYPLSAFCCHIAIVGTQSSPVTLVIHSLIKGSLTTTCVIALSKDILRNHIRMIPHHCPIFQLTLVLTCI